MGLVKKIHNIWLAVFVVLVSASVTSNLVSLNSILQNRPDEGTSGHLASAAVLESCCLYPSEDIVRSPANLQVTEIPDRDSPTEPDVWARMRSGFAFPVVESHAIRARIDEYINHPHHLQEILRRGEPYLFHILNRLEQNDMPAELALLPVIESAFDPFAISPAGAVGLWQFMPDTAAYVGLEQDWWYDGRRDIIASTEAALDYMGFLHGRFNGDWLLALAAYNTGGARVKRAIRRNRDAGKPADFWHLSLPAETQSYIPRLMALRAIIENPDDYNISLPRLANTRYFSAVEIQGQIEFTLAAKLAGISVAGLQRLNPGYDRLITAPEKSHTLLVPKSVERVFRERIARLPEGRRIRSVRHRIRPGDNLSTIAQHYRTTVPELRKVNRLKGNKIIAGQHLIVPRGSDDAYIVGNVYAGLM